MQRLPRFAFRLMVLLFATFGLGAGGNRLAYLDEFCDPYYPGLDTPKLSTPQWIGEDGVEAVIVLSVDDLSDTAKYEKFLHPILQRLKRIDGLAPVSLMTTRIDPQDPRLAGWLRDGLSLETHTYDHAAPLLQNGDLAKAKQRYDACINLLAAVPGNRPVAYRMPYCDSMNTVSPRFFTEIFSKTTSLGRFLTIDSSVFQAFTADDSLLPRPLVTAEGGQPRFRRYVLADRQFVNFIENYPYPYVIARLCWEIPSVIPDDNLGRRRNGPCQPATLVDMKAALDATVIRQGQFTLTFHPHGWISNDQIVEFIDYAVDHYGRRIKFLTFREVYDRLTKNLLDGQPLRAADGQDNGVRLLDVDHDGYMDVVVGNDSVRQTRLWSAKSGRWTTVDFPTAIVAADAHGQRRDAGVRFGVLRRSGVASFLVSSEKTCSLWHFDGRGWMCDPAGTTGLELDGPLATSLGGRDRGVRLRDLDDDGVCELIVGNDRQRAVFARSEDLHAWRRLPFSLPGPAAFVDAAGRDAGLRMVDLDGGRQPDIVFSNASQHGVWLFRSIATGWSRPVATGNHGDNRDLWPIVRGDGTNNGVWLKYGRMWVQNEDTGKALPAQPTLRDYIPVLSRTFEEIIGSRATPPP